MVARRNFLKIGAGLAAASTLPGDAASQTESGIVTRLPRPDPNRRILLKGGLRS